MSIQSVNEIKYVLPWEEDRDFYGEEDKTYLDYMPEDIFQYIYKIDYKSVMEEIQNKFDRPRNIYHTPYYSLFLESHDRKTEYQKYPEIIRRDYYFIRMRYSDCAYDDFSDFMKEIFLTYDPQSSLYYFLSQNGFFSYEECFGTTFHDMLIKNGYKQLLETEEEKIYLYSGDRVWEPEYEKWKIISINKGIDYGEPGCAVRQGKVKPTE
jgi:hypothetical protein